MSSDAPVKAHSFNAMSGVKKKELRKNPVLQKRRAARESACWKIGSKVLFLSCNCAKAPKAAL